MICGVIDASECTKANMTYHFAGDLLVMTVFSGEPLIITALV